MKCVISGSFRKFYAQVVELINEFDQLGIEVLSPAKSEIANPGEEFVILKSDDIKSVKDLEQKHLDAIQKDIELKKEFAFWDYLSDEALAKSRL